MQENLFEVLGNSITKVDPLASKLDFNFGHFNALESIYLLYANFYKHNSNNISSTPRISKISQFHNALLSAVKYWWKIHRISILCRLGKTQVIQSSEIANVNCSRTDNNKLSTDKRVSTGLSNWVQSKGGCPLPRLSTPDLYSTKSAEFLYEYSVRWTAFSNSIWKLSALLSNFEQSFTESYEMAWPQTHYKFRVFRMMTKIWNDGVLTNEVVDDLKAAFTYLLREYHKDMLQHIRDKTVLKDNTPMEVVFKKFFQALVDISINEKSVHFINCSSAEFAKPYGAFEAILLEESSRFVKSALEVGYKARNLKLVHSAFEGYSVTVRSFLTHRTQKLFEKIKTEIVIKFVRFLIANRVAQFAVFDPAKLDGKWNPTFEVVMSKVFGSQDSVFVKYFLKEVIRNKFDKKQFMRYWTLMMNTDWELIKNMYDNTLSFYERLLKSFVEKDAKITVNKQKVGIEKPTDTDEITFLSLLKPVPEKYVEQILFEYLGSFRGRETRSLSTSEPIESKIMPKSRMCLINYEKFENDGSEIEEDKDTQDCSETTNEFTQVFSENKQCWDERTKSMKKNVLIIPFKPSFLQRRVSM